MFNRDVIGDLTTYVTALSGHGDKATLATQVQEKFHLAKARSVFYGPDFAVRFCKADSKHFSNTVLSLSTLCRYDYLPFFVCLVTPTRNYLLLANTTFLKKISHSSHALRVDNIKGSFNGSDIMREYEDLENAPENFEALLSRHREHSLQENLERLVEANGLIVPTGKPFIPTLAQLECISKAADRAADFLASEEYRLLNEDLNARVMEVQPEIALAAAIDNVNVRGRVIEFLITAPHHLRAPVVRALHAGEPLPELFTADGLDDYERRLGPYITATDIKTKLLSLSSSPKGYNVDKLLSFLSQEGSVYLIFVVAIGQNQTIRTRLCSLFNRQLLSSTRIIPHWAGRNSRGVTQYSGEALAQVVENFDPVIYKKAALSFLSSCLDK